MIRQTSTSQTSFHAAFELADADRLAGLGAARSEWVCRRVKHDVAAAFVVWQVANHHVANDFRIDSTSGDLELVLQRNQRINHVHRTTCERVLALNDQCVNARPHASHGEATGVIRFNFANRQAAVCVDKVYFCVSNGRDAVAAGHNHAALHGTV
ncbi:hypothetical protein CGZ80_17995 [Rhodopirellula sp. MGV]|nr:hypothetical protein CGZ80_17995 [Rhodopirellula sp. MGV]PNY35151.1 hypothetical protein C2E31_19820 [Rhodopirellula baltica]